MNMIKPKSQHYYCINNCRKNKPFKKSKRPWQAFISETAYQDSNNVNKYIDAIEIWNFHQKYYRDNSLVELQNGGQGQPISISTPVCISCPLASTPTRTRAGTPESF